MGGRRRGAKEGGNVLGQEGNKGQESGEEQKKGIILEDRRETRKCVRERKCRAKERNSFGEKNKKER